MCWAANLWPNRLLKGGFSQLRLAKFAPPLLGVTSWAEFAPLSENNFSASGR